MGRILLPCFFVLKPARIKKVEATASTLCAFQEHSLRERALLLEFNQVQRGACLEPLDLSFVVRVIGFDFLNRSVLVREPNGERHVRRKGG